MRLLGGCWLGVRGLQMSAYVLRGCTVDVWGARMAVCVVVVVVAVCG